MRLLGLGLAWVVAVALLARAVFIAGGEGPWSWYVPLFALYLVIFSAAMLRPPTRRRLRDAVLLVQCLIALLVVTVEPEFDFMVSLFSPLAFEAALLFTGRSTWGWVGAIAGLTLGSLMLYLGPLRGLSLALVTVASQVVFAAFVVVLREIEETRCRSQTMLQELQGTHRRLQEYAAQAGELAAVEERMQIARRLGNSVARAVSGILADAGEVRSLLAQRSKLSGLRVPNQCDEVAQRLAALQAETQEALAQMRAVITELRPKGE